MKQPQPELITIIEGPTPDFHPSPQTWLQAVYEGPDDRDAAICQLRTNNGPAIVDRCQRAWREGRSVKLEYPDEMRMRQFADVIAMRLSKIEEGQLLHLWLSFPVEYEEVDGDEEEEEMDEDDDGLYYG